MSAEAGFMQRTLTYLQEVRGEVRKVTWPAFSVLRQTTIVVTLFVIALGIVIGIMDWMATKVLIDLLGSLFR
ncbi:MAG: preprotein translocase subunit SecE [Gemmatimonadales bacterium]